MTLKSHARNISVFLLTSIDILYLVMEILFKKMNQI